MFSFTLKLSKKFIKIFLPLVLLISIIFTTGMPSFLKRKFFGNKIDITADTAGARIDFLSKFGWTADADTEKTENAVIPAEFDSVYAPYNEIQKAQDFDLTAYKGKSVKIYTYKILNYPNETAEVLTSLLVHNGKIIGGDVHCSEYGGFMHGFDMRSTGVNMS